MKNSSFIISKLSASIEKKEILKGVDLTIKKGEIHAIMGPNGAGKTTLAMTLMGHPGYLVKGKSFDKSQDLRSSKLRMNGKDIVHLKPEERARLGLFVSFQQPIEITGVSFLAFLRTAYKELHPNKKIPLSEFKEEIKKALTSVGLSEDFLSRSVNEGLSGGERKRSEIAQLLVLKPQFVILDEIDSGLDVDSLRTIAKCIQQAAKDYDMGILLITHYQRILNYVKPNFVHILKEGKIKKSGGLELVSYIEDNGYAAI